MMVGKGARDFVARGAVIAALILVVVLLVNTWYVANIESQKQAYRKVADWENYRASLPNSTLEYAFFGDSHTRDDADPLFFPEAYNFAFSSEDYAETYFKLKSLYDQENITIGTAVFEVDMHTFSDAARPAEDMFAYSVYTQYASYGEISRLTGKSIPAIFLSYEFPVIGNGKILILGMMQRPTLTPIVRGWTKNDALFEGDKAFKASDRLRVSMGGKYSDVPGDRSMTYFLKAIKLAEDKGSRIVIVNYPVSREYDAALRSKGRSREAYYSAVFREVNLTLGSNYTVLDHYSDFFSCDECFRDPDHLNPHGAELLSQRLALEMNGFVVRK